MRALENFVGTCRMLHLFVMLAKLLICSNLIADSLNTKFTTTAATAAAATATVNALKANAVTSILTSSSNQHNNAHNWLRLRRQRRYLLFEKGASVGVQGNIAKAILPERPRGLNEIYEYTLSYELPTTLDLLRPNLEKKQQNIKTTITPTMQSANLAALNVSSSSYNNNKENLWPPQTTQWHATPYWPSEEESLAPWWQTHMKHQWLREEDEQQQQQNQISAAFQQHHRFAHMPILSEKITKIPSADSSSSSFAIREKHQKQQQPHPSCLRRNIYGNNNHNWQKMCVASRETIGRGRKNRSVGFDDAEDDDGDRFRRLRRLRRFRHPQHHAKANVRSKKKIDDVGHHIDESIDEFEFATNAERVFFDLMNKWANIHNYPPHHCIMRTLCESRHLLAAPGHSLFHDLLRILIDAALPAARRHTIYKKAIRHENLNDCAQQYATLCGLSFLQHFTEAVHGRFM